MKQAHWQRVSRCPIELVKDFQHMIIDDHRKSVGALWNKKRIGYDRFSNEKQNLNKMVSKFHSSEYQLYCNIIQPLLYLEIFIHKSPYAIFNNFGNRSTQNDDDIEMNSDRTFQMPKSLLGRFSISILSCYFYILYFIFYAYSWYEASILNK